MRTVERATICLPPEHMRALKLIAKRDHHGNLSAAVRALVTPEPVTKSGAALSSKNTA